MAELNAPASKEAAKPARKVSALPDYGLSASARRRSAPAKRITPVGKIGAQAPALGVSSERLRMQMIGHLREQGIRDEAVLAAMSQIERHRFVDEGLASRAYEDTPLPIGHQQTMSQPYIVARMTELLLASGPLQRVLEIGTGCGYQAAVLSKVAREVYSIERIRALHDKARANLRPFRLPNLRLIYGDGLGGAPEAAPFDAMLIAAAGDDLPRPLLEQLRIGGRIVAPLSHSDGMEPESQEQPSQEQSLCVIVRTGEKTWLRTRRGPVRFVPLCSGSI